MENDTHQRQCALDAAGRGADWVLQIDTDEVLPSPEALLQALAMADQCDAPAVEWPMRVLYRRLGRGRYLEVCGRDGCDHYEYPGPIAVRPGVRLVDARRTVGTFLRPLVRGDRASLQLRHPLQPREVRRTFLDGREAIVHNSWGRSARRVRSKIASWSHHSGWRSWFYYYARWKPAPLFWRSMRDFHPFAGGLWPALKPCACVPAGAEDEP